jgi:DNA-binding IclR family transcriptional regulator
MEVGLGAIAVPIHLPDIGVIYSLGTAGLIDRLTRRPVTETVALLRATLEPMTRALRNRESLLKMLSIGLHSDWGVHG